MKRSRSNDEENNNILPPTSHPLPPNLTHDDNNSQNNHNPTNSDATLIPRRKCPYLDTVDRQHLDFDMEKVCSVTLANMNIYACLVCGKFFQGRGQTTPGLCHSLSLCLTHFMNPILSFYS
jgi:hypothetical protein